MQVAIDNTLPRESSLRPTMAGPASRRRLRFCRHALTWHQQLPETPLLHLRQRGTERPSLEAPRLHQSQRWAAASWLPQCPPLHPPAVLPLQELAALSDLQAPRLCPSFGRLVGPPWPQQPVPLAARQQAWVRGPRG